MKRRRIIARTIHAVAGLFIVSFSAMAETYYVDADSGNDANSGIHDPQTDTLSPWKSLLKVFAYSNSPGFLPGDLILLQRGQEHYAGNAEGGSAATYLELFGSSGAPNQPIIIGAYGDIVYDDQGNETNRPIVRMRVSKAADDEWTESATPGVWMLSRQTFNTVGFFEDDIPLAKCADETCSDGGNWYHYNENCSGCIHWNTLYYKPTSGSPSDHVVHFSRWGTSASDDQSYITVRDLEFRSTHRPLRFRSKTAPVSDIAVENCVFYATEFGPEFEVTSSAPAPIRRIKVLNNYSRYVQRSMSFISQASPHGFFDVEVAYNVSDDANAHQVWKGDPELFYFQRMNNTHIHHNRVNGGHNTGIAMWNGNDGTTSNNLIEYNVVQNVHGLDGFAARGWYVGSGAVLDTCFGNTIRYNLIVNSDIGMVPANCTVDTQTRNRLYNNTLVGNGTNLLYRWGTRRWDIKNNIFANPEPSASVPVAVQVDHEAPDNDFISQRNLYFPSQGPWFRYSGTLYNYNEWLALSQQDATSLAEDPLFLDAASGDYHLARTSPAVDAAEDLGQTVDLDGQKIFKTPDIGADEYRPGKN
ncbi:MAG: hypothetical protein J5I92_11370 [Thiogranum sp.]|nr:hypothetical protein [Thiogranum sp.]